MSANNHLIIVWFPATFLSGKKKNIRRASHSRRYPQQQTDGRTSMRSWFIIWLIIEGNNTPSLATHHPFNYYKTCIRNDLHMWSVHGFYWIYIHADNSLEFYLPICLTVMSASSSLRRSPASFLASSSHALPLPPTASQLSYILTTIQTSRLALIKVVTFLLSECPKSTCTETAPSSPAVRFFVSPVSDPPRHSNEGSFAEPSAYSILSHIPPFERKT